MSVQFDPVVAPEPGAGPPAAAGSFGPLLALLAACRPGPGTGGPSRPRLVVFGADHGVAALGVSAYAPAETDRRLTELVAGAGPVAQTAAGAGIGIRVVDLRTRVGSERYRHEIEPFDDQMFSGFVPCGRIDIEDAMTDGQLLEAIYQGRQAADAEVDEGADLLIGSVCSVGVSTPAAVLAAAITGIEPVDATSRGSGISDAGWIRKAAAVRDSLYRARLAGTDAVTLLRVAGGPDLAALTGFLAQSAVRRTPVLIDDESGAACAVLAHRLAPGADAYMVAAAAFPERGHRRLLDVLGRDPLTAWNLRLGAGVAAMVTVQVARAVAAAAGAFDGRGRTADAIDHWDPDLL